MTFYKQYCQAKIAEQAIKLGARAAIIKLETDLSRLAVRDLCRNINRPTCAKGGVPCDHRHYLDYERNVHASLAGLIWQQERDRWSHRLAALVAAYQRYDAAAAGVSFRLDFNRVWALTRVLGAGQLMWVDCDRCGAAYLIEAYELVPACCRLCAGATGNYRRDKFARALRLRPVVRAAAA